MKRSTCVVSGVALVLSASAMAVAEPMRGIELHPDAPESVLKTFTGSGINTVVVSYRRQGDLADPVFVNSLARWGKLSKRYKVRCLPAIRVFGPPDYAGSKGGYSRAVESIAASPCVSPGDTRYWAEVVTPRVRRMAELAKAHGLAGALLDYQATLIGHEYGASYCFSSVCWDAFVEARHPDDAAIKKLKDRRTRVNWVRTNVNGGEYYAFLAGLAEREMTKAVQAARGVKPDVVLGVYGFWDAWIYQGVLRAIAKGDETLRPPAVIAEYERTTLARIMPFLAPSWRRQGLRFEPIARLPIDYYLPNDVQNNIAELDRDKTGFLLTATDALHRRAADVFHVNPPNGSPAAFAKAVCDGLRGQAVGRRMLANERHFAQYMPRLGVLQGKGLSGLFGGMIKQLTQSLQLPTFRLDATKLAAWQNALSLVNVIISLPGAGSSNPKGLAAAAPAFERFLRNGGMLLVLNGTDEKESGWLTKLAPRFACRGERKSGLKQAWLDNKGEGLLATPVFVEKLAPTGTHFTSFAPQYKALAKDDQGGAYLLAQRVGRGLLVVSASPMLSVEVLANAFFSMLRRGEVFNIELMPGSYESPGRQEVALGSNRLVLGVAELPESAGNVNVFVDVIDTAGKSASHQFLNTSVAGDGLRIPIRYDAAEEGAGRIVVTITDPVDNALIRRCFFPLLHDQRVEVLPDKNYYTTESHAVLKLRYLDGSLAKASVKAEIGGRPVECKLTGKRDRVAMIPIADLKPGEHKVAVSFVNDGQAAYRTTVTLRKEAPSPSAVKILQHRSCVLEVEGKPFFPFGCYGCEDSELYKLGANTTVSSRPGPDRKYWFATHGLRKSDDTDDAKWKMHLAYYMFDEPALNSKSPEHVHKTYTSVRSKDPYHPQTIVFVGSSAYPLYPDYMAGADCQMMDHYPRPFFAAATYGEFLRKVTVAARGRRNVWGVPQSFDWREIGAGFGPFKEESLHPMGPEALSYIYQSVIEGAGAITFWTHRYIERGPRRYEPFKKAIAEGAKLVDLVTKGTVVEPPAVKPLCAQVRCRALLIGKEIHIVAANYLNQKSDVAFTADYLKGKKLRQCLPTATALDGLADTFRPLQGKVYVVAAP